ncbi:MAG TPA: SoxR reducing system RseC family protein [Bacteroidales bacterium]|nr:SoxR reducing system RseC family protein [Bacteroidales bacterium]HOR60034.1 SoxR reducing system RseC family protein [Bacteroidales bacterium]HPL04386.1 SoxR reducing system RseC family protein [Bacteroidales bacterium]HPX77049.1 SoxR reducing system RseC family protein [Bacteroidales bacterium]HQB21637.1 SoxR reducing system RseC family protein [Bacteroidales bacterium]
MNQKSTIEHDGTVIDINDGKITVELTVLSACATCHSRSLCSFDSSQKTIEIFDNNFTYNIGETVKVIMRQSLGGKALFLAYILPFFVVLITLIICTISGLSEALSGIISILTLIPYYIALYLFKNKLKKEFSFSIKKI